MRRQRCLPDQTLTWSDGCPGAASPSPCSFSSLTLRCLNNAEPSITQNTLLGRLYGAHTTTLKEHLHLKTLGANSGILAPSHIVGTGERAPYLARLGNLLLGGSRPPCCLQQPGSGAAL